MIYNIKRYPTDHHPSLKAWSAADEFLVSYFFDNAHLIAPFNHRLLVFNDRFGFLTLNMQHESKELIIFIHSQIQNYSIELNLRENNLARNNIQFIKSDDELPNEVNFVYIRMPKSLELYEYWLQIANKCLKKDGRVVLGFMTKHFTQSWVEIGNKYFKKVEQSLTRKKARIMVMYEKKLELPNLLTKISKYEFNGNCYYTLPGVFSSQCIDNASKFLIENLPLLNLRPRKVLDLGCGNGLLGFEIFRRYPSTQALDFIDDFDHAVKSAKLNAEKLGIKHKCRFYFDGILEANHEKYDLVISNPPFHIGYEIDINLPMRFFRFAADVLSDNAYLVIVANKHLNYGSYLSKIFNKATCIASNKKYEILKCGKNIQSILSFKDEKSKF